MQNNTPDFNDPVQLILFIVAIILTALILYLAVRLIAGKKDLDGAYFLRLILVAIIIFVAVYGIGAVIGALGSLSDPFAQAIPIIVFTAVIYIIKYILAPATHGNYESWERSIWIALITFIFIYILNYITTSLPNGYPLIPIT